MARRMNDVVTRCATYRIAAVTKTKRTGAMGAPEHQGPNQSEIQPERDSTRVKEAASPHASLFSHGWWLAPNC